jgi:hypothetical protein
VTPRKKKIPPKQNTTTPLPVLAPGLVFSWPKPCTFVEYLFCKKASLAKLTQLLVRQGSKLHLHGSVHF